MQDLLNNDDLEQQQQVSAGNETNSSDAVSTTSPSTEPTADATAAANATAAATDDAASADNAAQDQGSDAATADNAATSEVKVEEVEVGSGSLLEIADGQDPMSLTEEDLLRYPQMTVNREGFRLQRVDIYNWSSFNNNVKSVYFGGQNVLMTGDNGAGKSSLIDAMTVRLYDVRKVTFNQAAGAEKGERSLIS